MLALTCAVRLVLVAFIVFFGVGLANAGSKPPCAPSLAACPAHGCETPGSPHALMNRIKRTRPVSGTPTTLTLDDFEALQEETGTRLPKSEKVDLSASARTKLKTISLPSGVTASEGDLVEVRGFIVGLPNRPSANTSGESVNCRLKKAPNNDFHIPIARRGTHSEFQAIVVEMIPQDRPDGWTLDRLHAVARSSRPRSASRAGLY